MVHIEINGEKLQVEQGSMIIEAADNAGVIIPRFCYHKKLSIAANCRMCLVEVEGLKKPLPACATPVTEGMKVHTKSALALDAQKSVMEFLLINHPLDCPICDQGGECELQDVAMGYGGDLSRFTEAKRVVADKDLGPLIATDMTRCIHCTRCVRFGEEIAGLQELGATGRGEHMQIGTYIEHSVNSELSGNVIDVCPVGALTSKPFRFKARAWELTQRATIAGHDCVGSHIFAHLSRNKVLRVVPKEQEDINEVWLADRDRFSYEALYTTDRITAPKIKENGKWREVSWEDALKFATNGLQRVAATHGVDKIGAVATASATVEEAYLLQKLFRALGCSNLDYRVRQQDFSASGHAAPALGCSIVELEQADVILLIGSNIRKDQPMLGHRVRKANLNGAKIMAINPIDFEFNFTLAQRKIVEGGDLGSALQALLNATKSQSAAATELAAMAQILAQGKHIRILLGPLALQHPQAQLICDLATQLAHQVGGTAGQLSEGPNAAGAWQVGLLPHQGLGAKIVSQPGKTAQEMLCNQSMQGLLLLGLEPERDSIYAEQALASVTAAEFVVSLATYNSTAMLDYANVILPITPYFETAGTFVNVEGRWQSFQAVSLPLGESRPAWKVLRVLANLFELSGFEHVSASEVLAEVQDQLSRQAGSAPAETVQQSKQQPLKPAGLIRIAEIPMYAGDAMLRRATALQNTKDNQLQFVMLNAATAAEHGLQAASQVQVTQGAQTVTMPLLIDNRVPQHAVYFANASAEACMLGKPYTAVSLERVQ